jgi:MFS transporter, PHS family, inorganic phosphate transporter
MLIRFQIPAEVFPTRFRCTCHGISAAAGKLGSILAQLIVASGSPELDWFGKVTLMYVKRTGSLQMLTRLTNYF